MIQPALCPVDSIELCGRARTSKEVEGLHGPKEWQLATGGREPIARRPLLTVKAGGRIFQKEGESAPGTFTCPYGHKSKIVR